MEQELRDQLENARDDTAAPSGDAAGLSNYAWSELARSAHMRPAVTDRGSQSADPVFIPDWARRHNDLITRHDEPVAPTPRFNDEAIRHQRRGSLQDIDAERPEHSNLSASRTRRIGPGPNGVPGRPPEGYQAIRGRISPGVVAMARSLLSGEYGTETPFEMDGKRYMARVEPHYGPPGRKNGPVGWHKGVTVYEAAT
ncbi:MAG TPA: hypothetical protein V6D08_01460 [Candidatus Obscuribacterales bacterium]